MRQNLIFLISALIIIIGLGGAVFYNLSFLVNTINKSFKVEKGETVKITQFDLKGFEQLKDKLNIPTSTPLLTPTPSEIPSPTATSSPLTKISPTPITTSTPIFSPSPTLKPSP